VAAHRRFRSAAPADPISTRAAVVTAVLRLLVAEHDPAAAVPDVDRLDAAVCAHAAALTAPPCSQPA